MTMVLFKAPLGVWGSDELYTSNRLLLPDTQRTFTLNPVFIGHGNDIFNLELGIWN
jgi:hypothetical protein